jgi:uncharacterized Tic20 family protein
MSDNPPGNSGWQQWGPPGYGPAYGAGPGHGPTYGPGPGYGPGYVPATGWPLPPPGMVSPQERTTAMWSHLAVLLGAVVGVFASIAFVPIGLLLWVIPLVIRSSAGDRSLFVRDHATESLNFELTTLLVAVVSLFLALILIGLVIGLAWTIFYVVVRIRATVFAHDGRPYRYPLAIRFVR